MASQAGMVDTIRSMGVTNKRVLDAVLSVDRALFVYGDAYADQPVPIGYGQTTSQPYTVARMIELLVENSKTQKLKNSKVLEVGTGGGWQTAILARLFKQVYSMELIPKLARKAKRATSGLGLTNVEIKVGDGRSGWQDHAPFQGIIVSADADEVPPALVGQLVNRGRLVIPVKGEMRRGTKINSRIKWQSFGQYLFVPLV